MMRGDWAAFAVSLSGVANRSQNAPLPGAPGGQSARQRQPPQRPCGSIRIRHCAELVAEETDDSASEASAPQVIFLQILDAGPLCEADRACAGPQVRAKLHSEFSRWLASRLRIRQDDPFLPYMANDRVEHKEPSMPRRISRGHGNLKMTCLAGAARQARPVIYNGRNNISIYEARGTRC
jgi:hypothetical protein